MDNKSRETLAEAKAFLSRELPGLKERMCLCSQRGAEFERLFHATLERSARDLESLQGLGMAEPTPEGRAFLDFIGEALVGPESELVGSDHLETALRFAREGGNVLVVQNHTSGADTVAFDHLVNQRFNGAARKFGYMAGHVVAWFLIPLAVSSGVRRFQIFSNKYKSLAEAMGHSQDAMRDQNFRALRDMTTWVRAGGRVLGLYPEGGRGENGLLEGDYHTAKIGEIMMKESPRGLIVLPTHVQNATSILPVVRGPEEFNEFICHVRRGSATIACGRPIPWQELRPTDTQCGSDARKRFIHAGTMRAIAALAPEHMRGVWS